MPYRQAGDVARGPHRRVGLALRVSQLFGGKIAQVGWLLALLGLTMVGYNVARGRHRTWDRWIEVPGWVTAVDEYDVDGTRCDLSFSFSQSDGVGRTAHLTGSPAGDHCPGLGSQITVRYLEGRPEITEVAELGSDGWPGLVVSLLVTIVGLAIAGPRLARGLRVLRLLANGRIGRGTVTGVEETRAKIGGEKVCRVTLEFLAEDGSTHRLVETTSRTTELSDDAEEEILYLPARPSIASALDHLPGQPRVRPDRVSGGSARAAAVVGILPVLAAIAAIGTVVELVLDLG